MSAPRKRDKNQKDASLRKSSANGRLNKSVVDVVETHYETLAELTGKEQARARAHYEQEILPRA